MVQTYKDLEKWVKIQMIKQEMTQRTLAERMGISYPRISEALHGKPSGKVFIIPIIEALGGDISEFQEFLLKESLIKD